MKKKNYVFVLQICFFFYRPNVWQRKWKKKRDTKGSYYIRYIFLPLFFRFHHLPTVTKLKIFDFYVRLLGRIIMRRRTQRISHNGNVQLWEGNDWHRRKRWKFRRISSFDDGYDSSKSFPYIVGKNNSVYYLKCMLFAWLYV